MKCAIELLAIQGLAVEAERIKHELLRKQREEEVRVRTITWCEEELEPALIEAAKDCSTDSIAVSFPIRFNWSDNEEEFCVLQSYISHRGRKYYEGHTGWMNYAVLRKYLQEHCLDVRFHYADYPCCNGGNYRRGATLTVFVP